MDSAAISEPAGCACLEIGALFTAISEPAGCACLEIA